MPSKKRSCMHDKNDNPPDVPVCYFCEEVTDEDHYCYGCKHYVCENCDESSPFGDHDVDDHQSEEDEE